MADATYDMKPVWRITVDALGVPGQRLFLLQARTEYETVTLKMEKEQVWALARGIDELLDRLEEQERIAGTTAEQAAEEEMALQEPFDPLFTVTQMGLAFDGSEGMLVLVVAEGLAESTANTARFWATPAQMRALSRRAKDIVAKGRPICALCGQPMVPDHACPRGNGHGDGVVESE